MTGYLEILDLYKCSLTRKWSAICGQWNHIERKEGGSLRISNSQNEKCKGIKKSKYFAKKKIIIELITSMGF